MTKSEQFKIAKELSKYLVDYGTLILAVNKLKKEDVTENVEKEILRVADTIRDLSKKL